MTNVYYVGDTDFAPIQLFDLDGEPVTTDVEVQITRMGVAPTAGEWVAAETRGSTIGAPIGGLQPGWFTVWARAGGGPREDCGYFIVQAV